MRQGVYLNVILTVNAVLLGGVLWTQVAGHPALAQSASAQTGPVSSNQGIPNAADQRQKVIEGIRDLKTSVDGMKRTIEGGKLKVEVTNLDQIKKVEVTNLDQIKLDRNKPAAN